MNHNLKAQLDFQYHIHNTKDSITHTNLDPLFVLYQYKNHPNIEYIALICALFAYGNVRSIVKFLQSLDFGLLDSRERILRTSFPYYRFQTQDDVKALFLGLCELKSANALESIITHCAKDKSCKNTKNTKLSAPSMNAKNIENTKIIKIIYACMEAIRQASNHQSMGFDFLVGKPHTSSPLKRWNMFMRWMVRKDNVDLGIWNAYIKTSDLLLPLDTHTFRMCQNLGLLKRKSYDIKAVLEVSKNLRVFDRDDPIKYDFALYRIGQKQNLENLKPPKINIPKQPKKKLTKSTQK